MVNPATCSIKDCDRATYAHGWCRKHYQHLRVRPACTVEGCAKRETSRGLCAMHQRRLRVHGSLDGGKHYGEAEKFYREVVLTNERGPEDDCLTWPFACGKHGYAQIRDGDDIILVHRRLCEEVHGEPPTPDHEAAHRCGRGKSGCVTKGHLRWATHTENMADKNIHGTSNHGERNGLAKLTEEKVRQMRPLFGTMTYDAIGSLFGVSSAAAWAIDKRKSWAWVK